jgi:hypothetical protein
MTSSSHPTQNGVAWVTNDKDKRERESTDSKKYEDPINVKVKTKANYATPEQNKKVDNSLTMHTNDLMTMLRSSVIKGTGESFISDKPQHVKRKTSLML